MNLCIGHWHRGCTSKRVNVQRHCALLHRTPSCHWVNLGSEGMPSHHDAEIPDGSSIVCYNWCCKKLCNEQIRKEAGLRPYFWKVATSSPTALSHLDLLKVVDVNRLLSLQGESPGTPLQVIRWILIGPYWELFLMIFPRARSESLWTSYGGCNQAMIGRLIQFPNRLIRQKAATKNRFFWFFAEAQLFILIDFFNIWVSGQ